MIKLTIQKSLDRYFVRSINEFPYFSFLVSSVDCYTSIRIIHSFKTDGIEYDFKQKALYRDPGKWKMIRL